MTQVCVEVPETKCELVEYTDCEWDKTPVLARRSARQVMEEQTVKIKVERLTRDKQVEEGEIEMPLNVYNNIENNETEFVRNSGRRKSLACKLKNLILR